MAAAPPEFAITPHPHFAGRGIPHVDEAAWSRRPRAAPSRILPGSAIKSQDLSFERTAPHDRPPRREFVSPVRCGSRGRWFYPRVTGRCECRFQPREDGNPSSPTHRQHPLRIPIPIRVRPVSSIQTETKSFVVPSLPSQDNGIRVYSETGGPSLVENDSKPSQGLHELGRRRRFLRRRWLC